MDENFLTKPDFYLNTGLTATDVNDRLVANLIDKTNALLNQKLGKIFTLTEDYTFSYPGYNKSKYIYVGAWQRDGLVVKRGVVTDNVADYETLVLNSDYTVENFLVDYPDSDTPVTVIKLADSLGSNEVIYLSGTYGFSDDVPMDLFLDLDLYTIIKDVVFANDNENQNGGQGNIKSSRTDKVQIEFQDQDEKRVYTTKQALGRIKNYINNVVAQYVPAPDYFSSVIG